MKKVSACFIVIISCMCFCVGCVSNHVQNGFGNAVWQSDSPYFYWDENQDLKKQIYAENPDYKCPKNAGEEEISRLYATMEINGERQFVSFVRGDFGSGKYRFSIYLFTTDALLYSGEYSYQKVKNKSHDYEVYLIVKHAYAAERETSAGRVEITPPFQNFTIYVTKK